MVSLKNRNRKLLVSFLNTMTKHFEYNLLPFYLDDTSPSVAHLIRSRSLSISFRQGYVLCPKNDKTKCPYFQRSSVNEKSYNYSKRLKKLLQHPDLKEMRNNCKEIVLPCIKFEDHRPPPLHTQENCFAHSIRWRPYQTMRTMKKMVRFSTSTL